MKNIILNLYSRIFYFIAKNRIEKKDTSEGQIHSHLVNVLSTGILLWAYTILAFVTIANPTPAIVGIICSIAHLFSPLLYRVSGNQYLNSGILLSSGLIHQATFAYFTGGFDSNVLIWLGIQPMTAGLLGGRKNAFIWATITTIVLTGFLIIKLKGFQIPNLITENGKVISQALITFGWIFLSTIKIWIHLLGAQINSDILEKKNQSIQNLVIILSHDLANHLAIILGRQHHFEKKIASNISGATLELPVIDQEKMKKIFKASHAINQIVSSVRDLFSAELGKQTIDLQKMDLAIIFKDVVDCFNDRLEAKKIKLKCSVANGPIILKSNKALLTNQVLGNLVSNAIKFSPENAEIILEAHLVENLIQITLTDSGIGIPDKIRNNLFELRASTSRPGTSGESGTGFGLPIVKVNVERLGGEIRVESKSVEEYGTASGTKFILEFPSE